MAALRAFVSFDFDHDEQSRNLFCVQGKDKSPTPFAVSDWSSREDLKQSEWKKIIRNKINRTNMLIVLVGRSMSSASGVRAEIAMADECNVLVFGVYVDGAGSGSTLPTGLPRNRTVTWTWPNVASGIDQCMTEGKNAS